ncbi:MAG: hydrogenase 3 maturation endopeptidase HyCI [Candidatus Omnitrophota bacterium]
MPDEELRKLQDNLQGKTVIFTVGNLLKGDDGFGPVLASRIRDKLPLVIDGGISPENFVHSIIREAPDTILVIDAADFKGKSGQARVFTPEEVQHLGYFSTHSFPISFILKYLKDNCQNAKVIFLGVQPKSVRFGEGLSQEMEETAGCLRQLLIDTLAKE